MIDFIKNYWIFGLGFFAQALFGLRILVQWWFAEKNRDAVSPGLFWKFGLAGSALFLVYGILRIDIVILVGQFLGYFIYVRNLQLIGDWNKFSRVLRGFLMIIPCFLCIWTIGIAREVSVRDMFFQNLSVIFLVGIIGQFLLNARFIYQLVYSERRKQSLLPIGFWMISLAGAIMIVIYSVYRRDPVLFLAQSLATIPYARNIVLSLNHSKFDTK